MKTRYIGPTLAMALASATLASCESDDMKMPSNPELPAVGAEVSASVIYQANPRMFATDNCLDALTAQVRDIAGMGCDILWVMPVMEQGEKDAFGSPYCVRDFKAVNPKYGTMADFKELVDAAHGAGMKVMLDWVANHTSWDNSWITEHPDYYVRDAAGNIQQASTWTDVAQLDFSNPATEEAMIDAMRYWVEQGGIDGFRCDYADGVPHSFWTNAIATLREIKPELMMLAESRSTDFYADGFDMIYDWEFAPAMSGVFMGGKPADLFSKEASTWKEVPEGKQLLRYTFNHDFAAENAVDTTYGTTDGIMAAYVLTAMLNGTPMIYSSMDADNISGTESFFNYNVLDWSAAKRNEFAAINKAYKNTAEVRRGELTTYGNAKTAMFTRSTPEHKMLVIVNTTGNEQTVKTPISLAGETMTDMTDDTSVTLPGTVTLGAYEYAIYMK